MKKLLIVFAAIGCISFVACKKDRVCQCSVSTITYKVTLNDATKRQAKDACISRSYDNGNGTITKQECELK
jgi:hypothetical protein